MVAVIWQMGKCVFHYAARVKAELALGMMGSVIWSYTRDQQSNMS